jgi:hypothetical protein
MFVPPFPRKDAFVWLFLIVQGIRMKRYGVKLSIATTVVTGKEETCYNHLCAERNKDVA